MADPAYIPPPKEVKISYITSVHPIWAFLLGVVVSGAAVHQVQKETAVSVGVVEQLSLYTLRSSLAEEMKKRKKAEEERDHNGGRFVNLSVQHTYLEDTVRVMVADLESCQEKVKALHHQNKKLSEDFAAYAVQPAVSSLTVLPPEDKKRIESEREGYLHQLASCGQKNEDMQRKVQALTAAESVYKAGRGLCKKLNKARNPDEFGKYFSTYLAKLPAQELIVAYPRVAENILSLTRCAEVIDASEEITRFQENLRSAYLGRAYNPQKDRDPFQFQAKLGRGKTPVFRFRL